MRFLLTLSILLMPALALSQSLGEVAKKERERREKNKQEGRSAIVVSEEELYPEGRPESDTAETETGGASENESVSAPSPSRPSGSVSEYTEEESSEIEDGDVPNFIPPDAPLEDKLDLFQRMRRHYEAQVREIDEEIEKNEARLDEIRGEIAATSALGGAGLPVAPQTGTGTANRQMTGQESQTLVAEQNRLEAANQQLRQRKEQLKLDLQQKGRAANIPPGYLRF